MKKRGISAVVATVLIILIVVVGVGIIWKVILPIFAELDYLGYSDVQLNIVKSGYTIYDPSMKFAFVQIERGADEVDVTGLEIGFNFEGTTKTYQTKEVPQPGGKYTYKFNFTKDSDMGIPQGIAPDQVTVAPIFTLNNKARLGKILDTVDMPIGKVYLSGPEWEKANKEAEDNIRVVHESDGITPGVPFVPVELEPGVYIILGESCTENNECSSGFCTDGVCCDSLCSGTCESCALPGTEGACTLRPIGDNVECGGCGACSGNPSDPRCNVLDMEMEGDPCGDEHCMACSFGECKNLVTVDAPWIDVSVLGCNGPGPDDACRYCNAQGECDFFTEGFKECANEGNCNATGQCELPDCSPDSYLYAGVCWYAGVEEQSCTSVCENYGGVKELPWPRFKDCGVFNYFFSDIKSLSCNLPGLAYYNTIFPAYEISTGECYSGFQEMTDPGAAVMNYKRLCVCNE